MKNKKFRINLFDLFFIILLFLLLFCVWYRFFGNFDKEILQNNDIITYSAVIQNIEDIEANQIKIGDAVFAKTVINNEYNEIGIIKDIKITKYKELQLKLDGTYEMIEIPNKCKLDLVIETKGKITNKSYYSSSNFELYTNEKFLSTTKYVGFELIITNINGDINAKSN